MPEEKRLTAKISGRVQGVFFRDNARKIAQDLDLVGWVQNMPDGSVQVVAEGDERRLERFLESLKEGSDSAVISDVGIKWEKPKGEFEEFEVKYD